MEGGSEVKERLMERKKLKDRWWVRMNFWRDGRLKRTKGEVEGERELRERCCVKIS